MSFGSVLREIQAFKVFVSILKSVPFENDNFLWSPSIELKFVFRSHFEVNSRK